MGSHTVVAVSCRSTNKSLHQIWPAARARLVNSNVSCLRMKYFKTNPKSQPPKLTAKNVPSNFQGYIALAEKYGVADDSDREEFLLSLTLNEMHECVEFLEVYDEAMDEWLGFNYNVTTIEYTVFNALAQAAEEASALMENGN